MSGLSLINSYISDSSGDSDEDEVKRPRLPKPDLSKVHLVTSNNIHIDNPDLHSGRVRSFPHVRGNWATFAFIKYPKYQLSELINKIQNDIYTVDENINICDDFHISLSKTIVLKYHQLNTFNSSLHTTLLGINSFDLDFNTFKVYCNEENTRTFISLQADYCSRAYLKSITNKIDGVLKEFGLPTFYKDPSFHMSILWLNGNKKHKIANIIEKLNEIDLSDILKSIKISSLFCKTGNKCFQYVLD